MSAVSHEEEDDVSGFSKLIRCPCGYTLHGADDDEVVAAAQEHARATHDQELTREQALAMARPA
jgi:predicted small metal-binding protein